MNNYPTGNVRINKLLYIITYAKGLNVWKCLVYKFERSILSILSRMLPPWESSCIKDGSWHQFSEEGRWPQGSCWLTQQDKDSGALTSAYLTFFLNIAAIDLSIYFLMWWFECSVPHRLLYLNPWLQVVVLFGKVVKPLRNKTLLEKALPRSNFKVLQPCPTSSFLSLFYLYFLWRDELWSLCFPQCPLDSHSDSHLFPAMEDFISSGTSSSDKSIAPLSYFRSQYFVTAAER